MNKQKKFYLTKRGLEKIKREYESLKKERITKITGEIPAILESEDLNPEYVSFQEDLERIDYEISEMENIFKNAVIIKKGAKEKNDVVRLGSKILLDIEGQEDELVIVGTVEANPVVGKISNDSPVGKALLGRKVGDKIIISSPIKTTYKIKKIISS